ACYPAGDLSASTDPAWLDQIEQSLCHREPLFLRPAGLAVGLALKERRYGVSSDSPPDPDRAPIGSPAPSVWDGGIRQVFSSARTLTARGDNAHRAFRHVGRASACSQMTAWRSASGGCSVGRARECRVRTRYSRRTSV